MIMKPMIAPSILSADFSHLADQIHQAEDGGADWIHIDVMDGHFVPNITMGPFIVETCRRITSLPLDVHLMIEKPENLIHDFCTAGASSLSVHVEGNPNLHRTIQEIHRMGVQAGVVINPGTAASALAAVLPSIDYVLVMTVNPGYSGQAFLPECLSKITQINDMITRGHSAAFIQVDGGINKENISLAYQAGARCFVAATSIFKFPQGIPAGIFALRSVIK